MKAVIIIDPDSKFRREVKEALLSCDPQLRVREYSKLEEFAVWIKSTIEIIKASGKAGLPEDEKEIEIPLVVIEATVMRDRGLGILKRTRDYFVANGLCSKDLPTSVVVTAFAENELDYRKFEDEFVANIIFKPFDKLILKEHIQVALIGRKPIPEGELYRQKVNSRIEMLKEVMISGISEVGFTTVSERPIATGASAKYYSEAFEVGKLSSAHASLVSCDPDPLNPGQFVCQFLYQGIERDQIQNLRKKVKTYSGSSVETIKGNDQVPQSVRNFVTLVPRGQESVSGFISKNFKNAKMTEYFELSVMLLDIDPKVKLDPNAKKSKLWQGTPVLKVVVDNKWMSFTQFDPSFKETDIFIGQKLSDVMADNNWWKKHIVDEDWQKLVASTDFKNKIVRIPHGEDFHFLRIVDAKPMGTDSYEVQLTEPTEDEKVKFLTEISSFPQKPDGIFIDQAFLGENFKERWTFIVDLIKAKKGTIPPVFILFKDNSLKSRVFEETIIFKDAFYKPLDSSYVRKKLKFWYKDLILTEDAEVVSAKPSLYIKVAQPVIANEISESGLSLTYTRALRTSEFRKFCLWMPHETGLPEFLASCNACEEIEVGEKEKKKMYICHFVFFGVRDDSLKHIRRWMKDFYVMSKEDEG